MEKETKDELDRIEKDFDKKNKDTEALIDIKTKEIWDADKMVE